MATIKQIINVCDLCGSEEDVRTRTVRIDRRTAELEACPGCWVPFRDAADRFINAGRRVDVPSRAAKRATKKTASSTGAEKPRSTRPANKAAAKKASEKPSTTKSSTRKSSAKKTAAKAASN